MAIKIDKKITGWQAGKSEAVVPKVIEMHEKLQRPKALPGRTYKIKPPVSDHALYITINDIVLNEGTDHEHKRPFEIFINSKNMEQYAWIVALTRVISAVFRKGGDVEFLAEELKAVFDPKGGYFSAGSYKNSMIAEIGEIIDAHLTELGLAGVVEELSDTAKEVIAEKRRQAEESGAMDSAQVCAKCSEKQVVLMDGCMTCLACGDSKCG